MNSPTMAGTKSRAKEFLSSDNSCVELHNSAMAVWVPPKGMKKANYLIREEFYRRINVMAAEQGKKPWQIMDSILEKALKPKKS